MAKKTTKSSKKTTETKKKPAAKKAAPKKAAAKKAAPKKAAPKKAATKKAAPKKPVQEAKPAEETLGYPKIADRRLEQLRFTMDDLKVDALVITHLPNIHYLTNFSGSMPSFSSISNAPKIRFGLNGPALSSRNRRPTSSRVDSSNASHPSSATSKMRP